MKLRIDPDPSPITVGGKAYQLYRLREICNVPAFFAASFDNPREIEDPLVQAELLSCFRKHDFDFVAVRSSATIEDSPTASFAGMFETVLNVSIEELIPAVKQVLDSASSKRVSQYMNARGLESSDKNVNVLIQKMVSSRVSGVCFSRTQEHQDSMLIEACWGLGEALVSGKVTPDSYLLSRSTLGVLKVFVGYQRVMLRASANSVKASKYEDVPFYKRNARKLGDEDVRDVGKISLLIEHRLGFDAADIEWAFEGSTLYILQARPYTGFNTVI